MDISSCRQPQTARGGGMMRKGLLLLSQATSPGLVVSGDALIVGSGGVTIVEMLGERWVLQSYAATGVLTLYDADDIEHLYDTVKLDSYGPYLREQSTEIRQACAALDYTVVPCTITGVRPIES